MIFLFVLSLTALCAGYIGICTYMYLYQRQLMYFPDKHIGEPSQYGLNGFHEERITTSDGVTLQLWYRPAATGFPTIAYFHGNASNLGTRADLLGALADKGFGIAGLSYRGYGNSDGTPSEQGLYNDARASLHFLTEMKQVPLNRIMLYGESLGTGVAVQMASEYAVAALMLQAPYISVAKRAGEMYPYLPVNLIAQDRYDSIDKIRQVHAPLLLFHGELDTVIPIRHGKALFEAANEPKQAFFFPDRAHNDFDSGVISAHVLDFANAHHLIIP